MAAWPALLIAPLLVLAEQVLAYALTPALCAVQRGEWLHMVAAVFTLASVVLTLLAARAMHSTDPPQRFFARLGTGVGALSTLVLLALWLPKWVLEPCIG
jgi:hypothetical protein